MSDFRGIAVFVQIVLVPKKIPLSSIVKALYQNYCEDCIADF